MDTNKILTELAKHDIKSCEHIDAFYSNIRSGLDPCYGFPCSECIFDKVGCLLSHISDKLNVSDYDVIYCLYNYYKIPTYESLDL